MPPKTESQSGDAGFLGIRPDRLVAAGAIALSAAFLLCGYEFIRSPSSSLFIEAYKAKNLPFVMALGPVLTLIIVYGYGRLLSVAGPRITILATCLFCALVILGCYAGLRAGAKPATVVLYAFREAYIVLLVEQVWSFINSTVRTDEGSKLNGPVCGVASLGAIAGGLLVKRYAVEIGTAKLLLLAAASLVPTGLCAVLAYRVGGEPEPAPSEAHGKRGHLGVGTLTHNPILWRLAILVALTQAVSTAADLQFSRYAETALPTMDVRTQYFGGFFATVNIGSAFCQFILAPLLLALCAHRLIHLAIPVVHLGVLTAAFARPGLSTAAASFGTFKVLDYSIFRAVKELLYIPLSFDARYRAKEIIDAFVYRASKGATSGALAGAELFMTRFMARALPLAALRGVIGAALLGWLWVVARLIGRVRSESPETPLVAELE